MSIGLEVWNTLHDGCVVGIEGTVPGDITVSVEIQYLRSMLPNPGDLILVRLSGCSLLEFRRFLADQVIVGDLTDVAVDGPEILSAQLEDDTVVLSMTRGAGSYMELHLRYENLSIYLENGRPVAAEELSAVARRYWQGFGEQN